jgi:hypothetical protein
MVKWKRTLRTSSSERFVATRDGHEVAAVDLHFLPDGTARGTVILLTGSQDEESDSIGWREEEVPDLLASLDDEFLPNHDAASGDLTYTVVIGRLIGSFELDPPSVM